MRFLLRMPAAIKKSVQTPQNAHQFLNASTFLALTQICPEPKNQNKRKSVYNKKRVQ
jgi:hypothetical protein